jgi:hypothetical protein
MYIYKKLEDTVTEKWYKMDKINVSSVFKQTLYRIYSAMKLTNLKRCIRIFYTMYTDFSYGNRRDEKADTFCWPINATSFCCKTQR